MTPCSFWRAVGSFCKTVLVRLRECPEVMGSLKFSVAAKELTDFRRPLIFEKGRFHFLAKRVVEDSPKKTSIQHPFLAPNNITQHKTKQHRKPSKHLSRNQLKAAKIQTNLPKSFRRTWCLPSRSGVNRSTWRFSPVKEWLQEAENELQRFLLKVTWLSSMVRVAQHQ